MLRGTLMSIVLFAGCISGVVAGYYLDSSTRVNAFVAANSAPKTIPKLPQYYVGDGKVQSVDTLHSKLVLVVLNPYQLGNPLTISVTYDSKTVFSKIGTPFMSPEQLQTGQKVRFRIPRTIGPLYLDFIFG